jgi:hypothetical protein
MTITKWSLPLLGLLFFLVLPAQADDVAYCRALALAYERYVIKIESGHTVNYGSNDAAVARVQCLNGNTAGIPVLERELRNAKVELPPRS